MAMDDDVDLIYPPPNKSEQEEENVNQVNSSYGGHLDSVATQFQRDKDKQELKQSNELHDKEIERLEAELSNARHHHQLRIIFIVCAIILIVVFLLILLCLLNMSILNNRIVTIGEKLGWQGMLAADIVYVPFLIIPVFLMRSIVPLLSRDKKKEEESDNGQGDFNDVLKSLKELIESVKSLFKN